MRIINFNPKKLNNITSLSIVVVKESDFLALKKYIKHNRIIPKKIYKVLSFPNGYEELVSYYLKYKYYRHYELKINIKILYQWNRVIALFNQRRYRYLSDVLNDLENIDLLLDIDSIKRNIKKFIDKVEIPLIEYGLFLNLSYDKKKLERTDICLYDIFNIVHKLKNINFNTYQWDSFNTHIHTLITHIPNDLSDSSFREKRLFFLSIYFYHLAELYRANGNFIISYNMLHRTLDIFLYYLCEKSNTHNCGDYLSKKFDRLNSHSPYSFTTNESNIIKEKLNKNRNKLYLTHGLYSVQKQELNNMFNFIKQFIKDKDGLIWHNTLKDFRCTIKLHPLDLFMNEPSFETYFIEVSLS